MLLLLPYVLQHVTDSCTIVDGVEVDDAAVGVVDGATFSCAVDVAVGAAVAVVSGFSITTAAAVI